MEIFIKDNPSDSLYGRILSHKLLSQQQERGKSREDNCPGFRTDYANGLFDSYVGAAVAYQKGTLCGLSRKPQDLYDKASEYYGSSSLAVFVVPENVDGLSTAVDNALGKK